MNKENLIKAINESPNFYGEIQKLINYRIINYDDLLTKEEQENLETLFGFEITEYAEVNLEDREYPRFPLFVKIQKILNENNINLSDYNLEDDEVKIKLLDQLFKIVQEKQEISVFTPRILFEIFGALLGIYKSAGRLNDLLPYTESYLDFICKL